MCNSVIIEGEKSTMKQEPRQGKRQNINTLQKKFTVKNKKESDSLIVYNEDYRDQVPKKRQTMAGKARASASRRSGKDSKHEGRLSSRRPLKPYTGHKPSHKRSQSLNKSTIEQRYRSVPQSGYHYEADQSKRNYTKKKLNWFFNNRTPQVHVSKGRGNDGKLDLSLKNAKKNLQNYFRENNVHEYKKKFTSLTGREKGNALLRKVNIRNEHAPHTTISFCNMVIRFSLFWGIEINCFN